jgi:hypothetical protein
MNLVRSIDAACTSAHKKINSKMAIVMMVYPQNSVSAAKQMPQMPCGCSPGFSDAMNVMVGTFLMKKTLFPILD